MKGIIIIVVLLVVFLFTKKFWIGAITNLVEKIKNKKSVDVKKTDGVVFCPQGVTRTFTVDIIIEELGDGTSKMSIQKSK